MNDGGYSSKDISQIVEIVVPVTALAFRPTRSGQGPPVTWNGKQIGNVSILSLKHVETPEPGKVPPPVEGLLIQIRTSPKGVEALTPETGQKAIRIHCLLTEVEVKSA